MDRNFKGIWIPKEIWLAEDLTLQEKVLLVEIDSLDDEETGCYASNSYFSKFFKLTTQRVSQIINALASKEYISITFEYQGKEIDKRILKINRPPYPNVEVSNKFDRYQENLQKGIKYSKEGYQENFKENNIYKNNINNNKIKYFDDKDLDNLFKEYLGLRKKIKAVNSDRAIKGLLNKLEPYPDNIKKQMIEESIVNSWKSVYPLKKEERKPQDFDRPVWLDMDL